MWKTILDLLFPIYCLGCGQPSDKNKKTFICPNCLEKIPLNQEPALRFGRSSALTGLLITGFYHQLLLKQAIYKYKYGFVKDLAEPLAELMIKKIHESPWLASAYLIAVPLHQRRLRWRGFNQAELLAHQISQKLKMPLLKGVLIRKIDTLPQAKIEDSHQRLENIKKAFALSPACLNPACPNPICPNPNQDNPTRPTNSQSINLCGKIIVLIDDVSTTGATLQECARALQPLQPRQIWGLVLARG